MARPGSAQTGVLFGQIAVVSVLSVGCVWAATQWAAAALGYSPRLGEPWFFIAGRPVYAPWQLFFWWFAYEAYAPHVFARAGMIAAWAGVLPLGAAVAMSVYRARQAKRGIWAADRSSGFILESHQSLAEGGQLM